MAWAQLIAQGVQNTVNAVGVYQAGKEEAAGYKYAAAQDEYNARLQAKETAAQEDTLRRQNRAQLAAVSAAMAEGGLAGGVFDKIYVSSARNLEQDAQNARYQGISQWANLKNSAQMNRFYAQQAKKNARFNALLTLHGGAAQTLASAANTYGWGSKGAGKSGWTGADSQAFGSSLSSYASGQGAFKNTGFGAGNKLSLF